MNLEEVNKLSEEALRIKAAELCGWGDLCTARDSVESDRFMYLGVNPEALTGTTPSGTEYMIAPNYLNDLNACHEFEMALKDKRVEYTKNLRKITRDHVRTMPMTIDEWELLSATAAQRCKALVLTMDGG